jgi:hypothetical protein
MGNPRRTSYSPRSSDANAIKDERARRRENEGKGVAGAGAQLAQLEQGLKQIFGYYAQVARSDKSSAEERKEGRKKPQRLLSGPKFQRMAYDANIIDANHCSPAQVDLIFRQACGNLGRLNFEMFMDAVVLMALAKFPEYANVEMKEYHALCALFDVHLSSFNGDVNDPLEPLVQELDNEWFDLLHVKGVGTKLHELYCRYFPIEVNEHYQQDSYVSSSQAQKGFLQMCQDFVVVRQVNELRAAMYATVRDAERRTCRQSCSIASASSRAGSISPSTTS